MRVLVACEYSGRVRGWLRAFGHDAWSCDLEHAEDGLVGRTPHHIVGDVRDVFATRWGAPGSWDMILAFPPCTYLSAAGARWWSLPGRAEKQQEALDFVRLFLDIPTAHPHVRVCVENPQGKISAAIRRPDQVIHPWMFGEPVRKRTCLWLVNLPPLRPDVTEPPADVAEFVVRHPETRDRWKNRSRTFSSIARAMASQWGGLGR